MRYTWECLKRVPFIAAPLIVLAAFGKGVLGSSSDHFIAGLVFLAVGMFLFGLTADVIRWLCLMVRWLHRAAAGE